MKKPSTTQWIIGGIILYLLLRNKSAAPAVKPLPRPTTLPAESLTPIRAEVQPASLAGKWEIDCYHKVI